MATEIQSPKSTGTVSTYGVFQVCAIFSAPRWLKFSAWLGRKTELVFKTGFTELKAQILSRCEVEMDNGLEEIENT